MTSPNTLKKLVSFGATALLAIGGSLVAAEPAAAQVATSAPVITGSPLTGATISVTAGVWATGTATGKWYYCNHGGSTAAATSVPFDCAALYTSSSNTAAVTSTSLVIPTIAYCGNTCGGSFGNSTVGADFRWIETNGSDISASAAVTVRSGRTVTLNSVTTGATSVGLMVSNGCTFTGATLSSFADWTLSIDTTSKTITSVGTANNTITLNFSGALTTGQAISVSYTKASDPEITCGATAVVADLSSPATGTVVASGGGGGLGGGTLYTITFNANGGTVTSGSLSGTQANAGGWITFPRLTKTGCTQGPWSNGRAANVASVIPSANESITASWVCTAVLDTVTAVVAESAKPLPVWAAPILKQVPTLSKTLTTDGGKVGLTDGDYSGLKSVTIGGKAVAFSIDAKGDVNIPVPAGKGGTSADLVVIFTGGSMVLQDAIKYVTPTDVATVPESNVAGFAPKSAKLSRAQTAAILYAAQVDHKANAIQCSGYAASKADVALATARATAACAVATGAYETLTKSNVVVVVNKSKAKTSPVGIKVYH